MQLRIARLCLDCEEVHDGSQCPVCASEAFVYLTRWVPAPDGRLRPKPAPAPDYEVYREMTAEESDEGPPARGGRLVFRSLMGLGVVGGVLGGLLGAAGHLAQRRSSAGGTKSSEPRTRPPADGGGD
jgi:hypothetical protein